MDQEEISISWTKRRRGKLTGVSYIARSAAPSRIESTTSSTSTTSLLQLTHQLAQLPNSYLPSWKQRTGNIDDFVPQLSTVDEISEVEDSQIPSENLNRITNRNGLYMVKYCKKKSPDISDESLIVAIGGCPAFNDDTLPEFDPLEAIIAADLNINIGPINDKVLDRSITDDKETSRDADSGVNDEPKNTLLKAGSKCTIVSSSTTDESNTSAYGVGAQKCTVNDLKQELKVKKSRRKYSFASNSALSSSESRSSVPVTDSNIERDAIEVRNNISNTNANETVCNDANLNIISRASETKQFTSRNECNRKDHYKSIPKEVIKSQTQSKQKRQSKAEIKVPEEMSSKNVSETEINTENEGTASKGTTPYVIRPRKKRKLYSPKDITELEDDSNAVYKKMISSQSKINLRKRKSVCYKEIEDERQEIINRKKTKEIFSPILSKNNDIFDSLIVKNEIGNTVKTPTAKDIAVYNYTSDSEDEDFKVKCLAKKKVLNKRKETQSSNKITKKNLKSTKNKPKIIVTEKTHEIKVKKPLIDERMRKLVRIDLNTSLDKERISNDIDEMELGPTVVCCEMEEAEQEVFVDTNLEPDDFGIENKNNEIASPHWQTKQQKCYSDKTLMNAEERNIKKDKAKLIVDKTELNKENQSPLPPLIVEVVSSKAKLGDSESVTSLIAKRCKELILDGDDEAISSPHISAKNNNDYLHSNEANDIENSNYIEGTCNNSIIQNKILEGDGCQRRFELSTVAEINESDIEAINETRVATPEKRTSDNNLKKKKTSRCTSASKKLKAATEKLEDNKLDINSKFIANDNNVKPVDNKTREIKALNSTARAEKQNTFQKVTAKKRNKKSQEVKDNDQNKSGLREQAGETNSVIHKYYQAKSQACNTDSQVCNTDTQGDWKKRFRELKMKISQRENSEKPILHRDSDNSGNEVDGYTKNHNGERNRICHSYHKNASVESRKSPVIKTSRLTDVTVNKFGNNNVTDDIQTKHDKQSDIGGMEPQTFQHVSSSNRKQAKRSSVIDLVDSPNSIEELRKSIKSPVVLIHNMSSEELSKWSPERFKISELDSGKPACQEIEKPILEHDSDTSNHDKATDTDMQRNRSPEAKDRDSTNVIEKPISRSSSETLHEGINTNGRSPIRARGSPSESPPSIKQLKTGISRRSLYREKLEDPSLQRLHDEIMNESECVFKSYYKYVSGESRMSPSVRKSRMSNVVKDKYSNLASESGNVDRKRINYSDIVESEAQSSEYDASPTPNIKIARKSENRRLKSSIIVVDSPNSTKQPPRKALKSPVVMVRAMTPEQLSKWSSVRLHASDTGSNETSRKKLEDKSTRLTRKQQMSNKTGHMVRNSSLPNSSIDIIKSFSSASSDDDAKSSTEKRKQLNKTTKHNIGRRTAEQNLSNSDEELPVSKSESQGNAKPSLASKILRERRDTERCRIVLRRKKTDGESNKRFKDAVNLILRHVETVYCDDRERTMGALTNTYITMKSDLKGVFEKLLEKFDNEYRLNMRQYLTRKQEQFILLREEIKEMAYDTMESSEEDV